MNFKNKYIWIIRLVIALIFIQTLPYKFTAHPDSVKIFSILGVEPYGRIFLGIVELFTSIFILINTTFFYGLFLSIFITFGAIISHLFLGIGVNFNNDGGALFSLAVINFTLSFVLIFIYIDKIKKIIKK